MTIFLNVIKEALSYELTLVMEQSVSKDYAPLNAGLTLMGYGRDQKLSRAKRNLITDLIQNIKMMKDDLTDDEVSNKLRELIVQCKEQAKVMSSEKGYDEGSFGPAMEDVLKLLEKIEERLKAMSLWDIDYSQDPFDLFCNQVAEYIVEKVIGYHTKNAIQAISMNPVVSSSQIISSEKDHLLLQSMKACKEKLGYLDIKKEAYQKARAQCVLDTIDKVCTANKELCTKHGIRPKFLFNITFFSSLTFGPDFQPGLGRLEQHMKCVLDAISKAQSIEEKDAPGLQDSEVKPPV